MNACLFYRKTYTKKIQVLDIFVRMFILTRFTLLISQRVRKIVWDLYNASSQHGFTRGKTMLNASVFYAVIFIYQDI